MNSPNQTTLQTIIMKKMLKTSLERSLGVRISRSVPMGVDSFHSILGLRDWGSTDVIFDVGANDGRSARKLRSRFPGCRIHSFEPVAATYAKLVDATRGFPEVKTYPFALGSEPGEKEIFTHEKAVFNSFSADWRSPNGSEVVKISTLDEVMAGQGVDFIHFLKVDTEGYEMEVLKGAERALRESRISIIQLEAGFNELVSPHTPLCDLQRYLAERKYYLYGIFDQHVRRGTPPSGWPESEAGRFHPRLASYCDAVFVRADPS